MLDCEEEQEENAQDEGDQDGEDAQTQAYANVVVNVLLGNNRQGRGEI